MTGTRGCEPPADQAKYAAEGVPPIPGCYVFMATRTNKGAGMITNVSLVTCT